MFVEILNIDGKNIIIKADNDKLISINATNLNSIKNKPNKITNLVSNELIKYFRGEKFDFSKIILDLNLHTPFRQKVLNELKNIPYASTITYKELAKRIGSKAYRAVGTALSKNPYLIILPCHRVIRSDETLGNFTCDINGMKKFLIDLEKNNSKKYTK